MRTLQRRRHKRSGMYATLRHEDLQINGNTNQVSVPRPPRPEVQTQSQFDAEYEKFVAEMKAKKAARLAEEAKAAEEAAAASIQKQMTEAVDGVEETKPADDAVVDQTEPEEVPADEPEAETPAEPVVIETKKSRKKKAADAE